MAIVGVEMMAKCNPKFACEYCIKNFDLTLVEYPILSVYPRHCDLCWRTGYCKPVKQRKLTNEQLIKSNNDGCK